MSEKLTLSQRMRLAWQTLTTGEMRRPARSSLQPWPETKQAPFIWPSFREGAPQWNIVDVNAYIEEGFELNALIYSAIMYKVRAMSTAPLRAYSGSIDKPDPLPPDAPLSLLVSRPNAHQSFTEFHGQNVVYLNVAGNCFVYMDRPGKDELPTAMYSLHPSRVVIVPFMDKGRVASVAYLYVPEGRSAWYSWNAQERRDSLRSRDGAFPLLAQDVMHVKFPNPADPLEGMGYGLSPIAPSARSADVDNKITEFLKLFFDRGTMTYGLLKYDIPLDDGTIADIKERWKEIYGGYQNWEDIGVLDSNATYQRMGFTFDEMGFGELDERNETRVVGVFGVPGILIGTRIGLTRATYSNVTELRKMFWEDTMVPETTLFETEYRYYLGQPDSDEFVAFDYSRVPALQPVRTERQTQVAEGYKVGVATRNEYRTALGLPPDEKRGNYYVMPLGLVEVQSGFAQVAAATIEAPEPPAPEDDETGAASAVEDDEQREEGETDGKALVVGKRDNDAMIACYVGDTWGVGDIPLDERHMTLAYIPDTMNVDKAELIELLASFSNSHGALFGVINAITVFENVGSSALVALVDSQQLPYWRNDLIDDVGIKNIIDRDHGYIPHITLSYLDDSQRLNLRLPTELRDKAVKFTTVTLIWNEDKTRYDFSLDGAIYGLPGDRKLATHASRHSDEVRTRHCKAVDKIATSWEGKFGDTAVKAFEADKRALLAILRAGKSAAYAGKQTTPWADIIADSLEYIRGDSQEQWIKKFSPVVIGLMEDQVANIANTFFADGKMASGPAERKQLAAEWFDAYMLVFAQQPSATTERNVAMLLQQAQQEGWSIPVTMERLELMFTQYIAGNLEPDDFDWFMDRMPAFRRENIARTETIRASNAASTQIYTEYGAPYKGWVATLDARCRPEHLAADGQIVAAGQPFNVGGERLQYPGDPAGSPSNTCQCRCTVVPEMEGG